MTRAIFWFQRDLSLDDNLAWARATTDHTDVLPVYVLDRRLLDAAGPYRRRQLLASIGQLAEELRALGGRHTIVAARDRPDLDATSHLSADLRFGSISPRQVVRAVGRATPGRSALVRQIAWRDWYAHLFAERPALVDHAQQPAYDTIKWRDDAATRWIHNRLRLVAASCLVKDHLVDWRVGERHFRHLLVDGDVSQNAGNWQWVAGTGPDAAPYFRVLNPITQARRFDPEGDYVRRWVPELGGLPGVSVHAPPELGPLELAAAGVVLGDTYPEPIIEHGAARVRALGAYAEIRS